jgi:hypothetical protein
LWATNDTNAPYSASLSENINDLDSFLRPLLNRFTGTPPDQPIQANQETRNDPYQLVYTFPNFESRFFAGANIPVPANLPVASLTSLQSSLDTQLNYASFSALVPTIATVVPTPWASRTITATLTNRDPPADFPQIASSMSWNLCELLRETRSRRARAEPPGSATTESDVRVRLSAEFIPNSVINSFVVTAVTLSSDDFQTALRSAPQQIGLTTSGGGPIVLLPGTSPTDARAVTVAPLQRFAVVVEVSAIQLLNLLPRSDAQRAQIVVTTNLGQLIADFLPQIETLRQWAPILGNANAPANAMEVERLVSTLDFYCTQEQYSRLLNVPVLDPRSPFPGLSRQGAIWGSGLDDVLGDLGPVLGDLSSILNPGGLRPQPTPGDPRPIVNRPWLYGPPASPVPRLEPILDLALRAARPQPMTPSV